MKTLYKILLTYERLYSFISLLFALTKNGLIKSRLIFYSYRLYIKYVYISASIKAKRVRTVEIRFKSIKGFTLVELIVTVAILAIIATIATPAIFRQLASMEAKRVKSQLEGSLSMAKAESYIRRQNVWLCLSNAGGRCDRNSDKTLLLFIDSNGNNHFDTQVDSLLSEQPLNLKYGKLRLRVGNQRHYTKFWGDSGNPRGHFGHIKYCPTSSYSTAMYQISFSQTGNVKQKLNADHPTECDK